MSRRGSYNGGGTIIREGDPSWYSGTQDVPREPATVWVPERSPAEERAFREFEAARVSGRSLIKAGQENKKGTRRVSSGSVARRQEPPSRKPRTPEMKKLLAAIANAIVAGTEWPSIAMATPELQQEIERGGGIETWADTYGRIWHARRERESRLKMKRAEPVQAFAQKLAPAAKAPIAVAEFSVGDVIRIGATDLRVTAFEKNGKILVGADLRTGEVRRFNIKVASRVLAR